MNEDKTEEFVISRSENNWKDCKLLGSKLDTNKDIEKRKSLTINVMKELKHLFKSHESVKGLKSGFFNHMSTVYFYTVVNYGLLQIPSLTKLVRFIVESSAML